MSFSTTVVVRSPQLSAKSCMQECECHPCWPVRGVIWSVNTISRVARPHKRPELSMVHHASSQHVDRSSCRLHVGCRALVLIDAISGQSDSRRNPRRAKPTTSICVTWHHNVARHEVLLPRQHRESLLRSVDRVRLSRIPNSAPRRRPRCGDMPSPASDGLIGRDGTVGKDAPPTNDIHIYVRRHATSEKELDFELQGQSASFKPSASPPVADGPSVILLPSNKTKG